MGMGANMIKRSCQSFYVGLGLSVALLLLSSCNKIKISEVSGESGYGVKVISMN